MVEKQEGKALRQSSLTRQIFWRELEELEELSGEKWWASGKGRPSCLSLQAGWGQGPI